MKYLTFILAIITIIGCKRMRTDFDFCVQECRVSMRKNLPAMGFHPDVVKSMGREGLCERLCMYPEDVRYPLPMGGK